MSGFAGCGREAPIMRPAMCCFPARMPNFPREAERLPPRSGQTSAFHLAPRGCGARRSRPTGFVSFVASCEISTRRVGEKPGVSAQPRGNGSAFGEELSRAEPTAWMAPRDTLGSKPQNVRSDEVRLWVPPELRVSSHGAPRHAETPARLRRSIFPRGGKMRRQPPLRRVILQPTNTNSSHGGEVQRTNRRKLP